MSLKLILRDRETWTGLFVILALALVMGTVSNLALIKKFLRGEFRQAFFLKESYPGLVFITLPEVVELWHNQTALIVDSRQASEFRRGHVPGAISVPLEEIKSGNYGSLERLTTAKPLVIYCEGGDCLTSYNLARFLYERGYRDLRVFSGGWAEWLAAGLPVEKEDEGSQ